MPAKKAFFKAVKNNDRVKVSALLKEHSPEELLKAKNENSQTAGDLALNFHAPFLPNSDYLEMFKLFLSYKKALPSGKGEYGYLVENYAREIGKQDIVNLFIKESSTMNASKNEQTEPASKLEESIPQHNNLQFTENDVNPSAFYDEILMLKVWDTFIQKLGLNYWISNVDNQLTSLFNANTLSIPASRNAAILINTDGSLYKRMSPESSKLQSISICSLVNHKADSVGGYNAITANLKLALEQIVAWNNAHPTQLILSHLIQFPYHVSELHWNLGVLELEFEVKPAILNLKVVSLIAYDPYSFGKFVSTVKDAIQSLIQVTFNASITVTNLENNEHPKQQYDGTSCGVISTENGKDIIEGRKERLKKSYQPGAKALRLKHLNEVQNREFQKRQWDNRSYTAEGDTPLANKDLIKTKLLQAIEGIDVQAKLPLYKAFSLLADICGKGEGYLVQIIEQLRVKEQLNNLTKDNKARIANLAGQEVYFEGQLNYVITNPTTSVFNNIKKLFLSHQNYFRSIQVADTNLFDAFFRGSEYKFIDGARTFFEEFSQVLKQNEPPDDNKDAAKENKSNPLTNTTFSLIYKMGSYPGFTVAFLLLGDITTETYSLDETGNLRIFSTNEESLIFLRQRLINEFLSESNDSLKDYIDDFCNQIVLESLLSNDITIKKQHFCFLIPAETLKLIILAIDNVKKFKETDSKKNKFNFNAANNITNIYHTPQSCLNEIRTQISLILDLLTYCSKLERNEIHIFKEALYRISWRASEIPSSIKFNMKSGILSLFAGRNWLLLDYLANSLSYIKDENLVLIVQSIKEDLEKFKAVIPLLIDIINGKEVEVEKDEKIFLTSLEEFLGFYFDKYLLNKIIGSSQVILDNINFEDDKAIANFLLDPIQRKSVYRVFEIIGEATKNLTHRLKDLDKALPWGAEIDGERIDLFGSFRNKVQHDRARLELIYQINPPIFINLLKIILKAINQRTKILYEKHSNLSLVDTDYQKLNQSALAKMEFDYTALAPDVGFKDAVNELKDLISMLEFKSNLLLSEIKYFLKLAKEDKYHEFIILLKKPEITIELEDFANHLLSFIDADQIRSNNITLKEVKQRLKQAYRNLLNRNLTEENYSKYTQNFQEFDVLNFKQTFRAMLLKKEPSDKIPMQQVRNNIKKLPLISVDYSEILNNLLSALIMEDEKLKQITEDLSLNQKLGNLENYTSDKDPFRYLESIEENILKEVKKEQKSQAKTVCYRFVLDNRCNLVERIVDDIFKAVSDKCAKDLLIEVLKTESFNPIFGTDHSDNNILITQDDFKEILINVGLLPKKGQANSVYLPEQRVSESFLEFKNKILCEQKLAELVKDPNCDKGKIKKYIDKYVDGIVEHIDFDKIIDKQLSSERNKIAKVIEKVKLDPQDQKAKDNLRKKLSEFFKDDAEQQQVLDWIIKGDSENYQSKIDLVLVSYRTGLLNDEKHKKKQALSNELAKFIEGNRGREVDLLSKVYFQARLADNEDNDRGSYLKILLSDLKINFEKELNELKKEANKDKDIEKKCLEILEKKFQQAMKELHGLLRYVPERKETTVEDLIKNLEYSINRLDAVFDKVAGMSSEQVDEKLVKTCAEFLIEDIGQFAGSLFRHPDYRDTKTIFLSKRNYYILNVARKMMAHHPISIADNLLEFYVDQLVLYAKPKLKHYGRKTNPDYEVTGKEAINFQPERLILFNELQDKQFLIKAIIIGYGFKDNFKLFNTNIGIQSDLDILVELENVEDIQPYNLIQLEIELSKTLNANIKVYTYKNYSIGKEIFLATLENLMGTKLTRQHVSELISSAISFDDYIEKQEMLNIFDSMRWTEIQFEDKHIITQSEYLETQDIAKIIYFLFPLNNIQSRLDTLFNRSALFQAIRDKLIEYNNDSSVHKKKITEFFELINEWFIKPLIGNYLTIKVPIVAENGEIKYEFRKIKREPNKSDLEFVNSISSRQKVLQIAEQKVELGDVIEQTAINQATIYITSILIYSKNYITDCLNAKRMTVRSNLHNLISITYAEPQAELIKNRKKQSSFCQIQLERDENLQNLIKKKAKIYSEKILAEFVKLNAEEKDIIITLLIADKELDVTLGQYYADNEERITLQYKILDQNQRKVVEEDEFIINDRNYFCNRVKANPNLIASNELRAVIESTNEQKKRAFDKVSSKIAHDAIWPSVLKRMKQLCDEKGKYFDASLDQAIYHSIKTQAMQEHEKQWVDLANSQYEDISSKVEYYKTLCFAITDPEIISLFVDEGNKNQIGSLVFDDFCSQYIDPMTSEYIFSTGNKDTYHETFSLIDDINYSYTLLNICRLEVLKCSAQYYKLPNVILKLIQGEAIPEIEKKATELVFLQTKKPLFLLLDLKYKNIVGRVKTYRTNPDNLQDLDKIKADINRILTESNYFELSDKYQSINLNGLILFNSKPGQSPSLQDFEKLEKFNILFSCDQSNLVEILASIVTTKISEHFIENLPNFIIRNQNVIIGKKSSKYSRSPSSREISNIFDLLNHYLWEEYQIEQYKLSKDFEADNQIVKEHWEFLNMLNSLNNIEYQLKQYERLIREHSELLISHTKQISTNNVQKTVIQKRLEFYLRAFAKYCQKQIQIIKQILDLSYSKNRVYEKLCDPTELQEVIDIARHLSNVEHDSILFDLLQTKFADIKNSAMQELFSIPEFEHLYGYSVVDQKLRDKFLIEFNKQESSLKQENLDVNILIKLAKLLDPVTKKKVPYPSLLADVGIRKNKVTGPRIAEVLGITNRNPEKHGETIIKKYGNETAVAIAKNFSLWAKDHNKNFNMRDIQKFIEESEEISSPSNRP